MKLRKPIARETVVGVADFKARCLELLDGVDTRGDRYVITKRGKPIAAVAPISGAGKPLRGLFRDQLTIKGDIVHVDWRGDWEAAR